jgi:hypothetical protein
MFWVIIQGAFAAITAYLAFHVTVHPLHKKDKVKPRMFKIAIIGCCALSIAVAVIQYRKEQKEKDASKLQLKTLSDNQNVLANNFQVKTDRIESNQFELGREFQKEQQDLRSELATNPAIDLSLRTRILADNEQYDQITSQISDLKSWEDHLRSRLRDARALKQNERQENLVVAQNAKEKLLPNFDYAIKSLASMLEMEAVGKGDKSVLAYDGLPNGLPPGEKSGEQGAAITGM